MNLLDKSFSYTPACATDISKRWPNLAQDNERRRKEREQRAELPKNVKQMVKEK